MKPGGNAGPIIGLKNKMYLIILPDSKKLFSE
jgi:hypothetical protein